MHVGEKIRQLRLHQQLTQGELVDGICSVAFLSKVEKGLSKPSAAILEKLAARLQIPVNVIDETQEDDIGITIDRITEKFLETATITDDEARILDIERYYSQPLPRLLLMYSCLIHYWLGGKQRKDSFPYIEQLLEQTQNLIAVHEEHNYPMEFFVYYEAVANYYSAKSEHTKTELYLEYAGRLIHTPNLPEIRMANYFYIIGVLASHYREDDTTARKNYEKAILLFKGTNQHARIANTYCSIAWTYIYEEKYSDALNALKEVEVEVLSPGTLLILHNCYTHIYKSLGDFHAALNHLELAEHALEGLNQQDALTYLLRAKVEIYIELKKWDSTDHLISQGIQLSKESSYHYNLCKFLQYKATIQSARGDYSSFEKYLRDAIDHALEHNIKDLLMEIPEMLADYYSNSGSYKKAVKYYQLALAQKKTR